ncbi:MAG: tetratricopeptide repeat protein [Nitrospirae bacterium]|nr:tetratricopeptide repeat protein [Nitrospirota bacterium]
MENLLKKNQTHSNLFHIACLAFLVIIIYANSLNVPFQWDEEMHIVNEPIIKDFNYFLYPSEARGFEHYNFFISRYIAHLTFALNYRIHGLSVTGYHVVNIAIHMANAILVYLVVLLTFKTPLMSDSALKKDSRLIALLSSLLFAAHPLQTAAVTYVMQRFASLVAFFYLLSVAAYVKSRLVDEGEETKAAGRYRRIFFYGISFISAVLAMKTKENAFTLPFMIMIYEFCFFKGPLKRRMVSLVPILFLLGIIPLTLMSMAGAAGSGSSSLIDPGSYLAGFTWDYSRGEYFFTQFRVIVTYLRMLFLPLHLDLDYEYPVSRSLFEPQVAGSFVFLSLLFAIGVYLVRGKRQKADTNDNVPISNSSNNSSPDFRLMGFGILWFFIALSVESLVTTPRLIETYRAYLPSVGMIICTVTGVFMIKKKTGHAIADRMIMVIFVIALVLMSFAAYRQNEAYGDGKKMWEDTVKRFPRYAMAHNKLGVFYIDKGMIDKAMEQFLIAVELKPDLEEAHNNLGNVYCTFNEFDKAAVQYMTTIKLNPNFAEAHFNLGLLYYRIGEIEKAKSELEAGLKIKPDVQRARQLLEELSRRK